MKLLRFFRTLRPFAHRMRSVFPLTMLLAAILVPTVVAEAAGAPDFTQFGFPTVVASVTLQPGQGATVGSGQVQAVIPPNAFSHPVKFELLQGSNATFQAIAPAGQVVVANFAFRVTDLTTGQLIGKFSAPVIAVITDPRIGPQSQYLDTTPTNPIRIEPNPLPPQISDHTLKHGNLGAPVGWIVTSPAPAALPRTGGFPVGASLGVSVVLLALGLIIRTRRGRIRPTP